MNYTYSLLRIAVLSLCFTIVVGAQTNWKGSYQFGENGGKTHGGTAIIISHELNVLDGGDGLTATLDSNGYQTSAELVCKAKIEGSKLLIFFQSYGETNMFEPYKEGDLLLTLERRTLKGKTVILTHWGKFTPSIPKNERSGKVYFRKAAASRRK